MAIETPKLNRLHGKEQLTDKNGTPTHRLMGIWQDVVTKIENAFTAIDARDTIQDGIIADLEQAQADILVALENAGIALNVANAIMPDIPDVTVTADYTGTVLTGQLPRNIAATRYDGDTDVTTSSTWSATTLSGDATYTIGAATGVLNITALVSTTVIEVASTYNSITRRRKVTITKALQDPPPSSGTTTAYDSSITSTSLDSYGSANAGPLTITCGASGAVELTAPLDMTTLEGSGSYDAYGKWQVSPAGAGTWSDVDTEILSDVAATNSGYGSITVNMIASGLTASSNYDFQLLLRNASGTATLYYSGTATAVTE